MSDQANIKSAQPESVNTSPGGVSDISTVNTRYDPGHFGLGKTTKHQTSNIATLPQVLVGSAIAEYSFSGGSAGGSGGCDHGGAGGAGCGGGGGGDIGGGSFGGGGGGGGGGVEQCSTVTETVSSVVQETGFETQCATVKCPSGPSNS